MQCQHLLTSQISLLILHNIELLEVVKQWITVDWKNEWKIKCCKRKFKKSRREILHYHENFQMQVRLLFSALDKCQCRFLVHCQRFPRAFEPSSYSSFITTAWGHGHEFLGSRYGICHFREGEMSRDNACVKCKRIFRCIGCLYYRFVCKLSNYHLRLWVSVAYFSIKIL